MATPICTCGHSKTDHLTGRCVNRTMRFNAASGGTVANRCGCKKFTAAAVESAIPPIEEIAAAPTESAGTAPAELATESEPSTETTAHRRKK